MLAHLDESGTKYEVTQSGQVAPPDSNIGDEVIGRVLMEYNSTAELIVNEDLESIRIIRNHYAESGKSSNSALYGALNEVHNQLVSVANELHAADDRPVIS
jgi:hypothetical protein